MNTTYNISTYYTSIFSTFTTIVSYLTSSMWSYTRVSLIQSQLHTVACKLVLVHGTYLNIQLTSHINGGTTYSKLWASIVHSTVVVSLAWVASWDCEGQVGLSWKWQVGWWNGVNPAVGHSLWWWWGHTTLEYHSRTKGVWTLWGICCDGDFMVGRSCMRKRVKQNLYKIQKSLTNVKVEHLAVFLGIVFLLVSQNKLLEQLKGFIPGICGTIQN